VIWRIHAQLASRSNHWGGPFVIAFMSTSQAVHGTAPDPPCGEFNIEAVAEHGTRRRVPCTSATRIRFADMTPARRIRPGRGSGTCRADGGRLPMAGTWAMNRGWNATR
jgi:hypothetical protein